MVKILSAVQDPRLKIFISNDGESIERKNNQRCEASSSIILFEAMESLPPAKIIDTDRVMKEIGLENRWDAPIVGSNAQNSLTQNQPCMTKPQPKQGSVFAIFIPFFIQNFDFV